MTKETDKLDVGVKRASSRSEPGFVLLFAPRVDAVPNVIPVPAHAISLGREPPPGGVSLPFGSVSRVHATVSRHGDGIEVDDLESRNGTFVNGRRVDSASLRVGDTLRIGEVVLGVVNGDLAARADWPLAGRPPPAPLDALRGGFAMETIRFGIARMARTDLSILVLGETGTGKELVARALHAASGRTGNLATVNCAAIPANLLESELFGYKRGAFTGAERDRVGIVKSANGGTLFLDEIGDMPVEAQAKLLRVLETRTVHPLGSPIAEQVDVRVVAATHRPLGRLVSEGKFRGDLFARLNGHALVIPPLRDRREDIFQLARLFLARAGGDSVPVAPAFMIGLVEAAWPYNVRELEAAMRRALALADGSIDERHLPPPTYDEGMDGAAERDERVNAGAAPDAETLRALLVKHEGNVSAVGRELGKDRTQIHRWLKRWGIALDDFRRG